MQKLKLCTVSRSLLEIPLSQIYLPLIVIYEEPLIHRKLWDTLKNTMTLATERKTIMHSHRWQTLCKRIENRIFDKLFAYKDYMAGGFPSRLFDGESFVVFPVLWLLIFGL